MDFRHNAARRRRVMRDERLEVEPIATQEPVGQPFRRYQSEVVFRQQPTLLDWMPRAPWVTALTVLALLIGSTALLALPHWQPSGDALWAEVFRRAEWWSIDHPGSLAQTLLIGLGSAQCLLCYQIYHLRRHRSDDYHGAYQVWWWALFPATGLAVANMAAPSQLLGFLMQWVAPSSGTGLWPVGFGVAACVLVIALVVRLYYEVRDSRWSVLGLAACGSTFLGYTVVAVNARVESSLFSPANEWVQPGAWWLMANVFLTSTLLCYLSFVYRDVLGYVTIGSDGSGAPEIASDEPVPTVATPAAKNLPAKDEWLSATSETSAANVQVEVTAESPENGILARRKRRRAA